MYEKLKTFWKSERRSATNLRQSLKWGFRAALVVALISLFLPNQYTSKAKILPKDPNQGASALGSLMSAAATFGIGGVGNDDPGMIFVDIINSRWMGERLLGMEATYRDRFGVLPWWQSHKGTLLQYLGDNDLDSGMEDLKDILMVQRDTKSGTVSVSVSTSSPELSQAIANAVLQNMETFLQQFSQTEATSKAKYSRERLREARTKALATETKVLEFLRRNQNADLSPNPDVRLENRQLQAELDLDRQIVSMLSISLEQAELKAKEDMPIVNVLDAGHRPTRKSAPSRGLLVIASLILGGLGSLLWRERQAVSRRLFQEG